MHPDPETLVSFGGGLKALDDTGRVGGYLVLFGSADRTDASQLRDFFTAETDFGLDVTTKSRLKYHHGLDPDLGLKTLGVAPATLEVKSLGVWLEAQLDLRDEYEKAIFALTKQGKLGLSSGTAPHLIRRQRQANGSHKIQEWPLGLDASITPTPAEPRTALVALKSLDVGSLKGQLLGPGAEPAAAIAAVRVLMDRLSSVAWDIIADEKRPPADRMAAISAAFAEFGETSLRLVAPLLIGPADAATDPSALKAAERELLAELALIELDPCLISL